MDSKAEPPRSENCDQTWQCLPAISHYVDQITFSPDGKILASKHKSSTEYVKLWDVATGQELYSAEWSNLWELTGGQQKLNFLGYPLLVQIKLRIHLCRFWELKSYSNVPLETSIDDRWESQPQPC